MISELHVAVGVIEHAGRYLLTRRRVDAHEGGRWEFPGGKFEAGESAHSALARELREELGIEVLGSEPLIEIPFSYPELDVHLHVRRVTDYQGVPEGREGQPLRWYVQDELPGLELPAANRGILAAIALPHQYLITPEPVGPADVAFIARLRALLEAGVRLVQLRAKTLSEEELLCLAQEAIRLCEGVGARLLLNAMPELAQRAGTHGVHLSAGRAAALAKAGVELPTGMLVGASCHTVAELELAESLGVDYVLCSPVRPTDSHPGAPVLGWDRFAAMCAAAKVPVYALGGVGPADLPTIHDCGGHGAAGISAYWSGG
ncbi:MAG: Nudix family hydrolase [Acidihalobacter sp.]|jgi:8-oxo-dGTP diphosphatase|uniref:Nudix family hydrolase n=1 Tax=Acidihalobacter sp. TaxID=1872108 RepID=UPI00307E72DC